MVTILEKKLILHRIFPKIRRSVKVSIDPFEGKTPVKVLEQT